MKLLKMKRGYKHYINYVMYILLFLSIFITLGSSFILWFILPRGIGVHGSYFCNYRGYGGGGNPIDVLGWYRYTWIDIHSWISILLLAIVIIHIILHWTWIKKIIIRIKNYVIGPIRKITEQYIVIVVLFILFILDCLSGFVIWLILPRGEADYFAMINNMGRTFWSLQRNVWLDIHAWLSVLILAIVIIHLILNWKWILRISGRIVNSFSGLSMKKRAKNEYYLGMKYLVASYYIIRWLDLMGCITLVRHHTRHL